MKLGKLFLCFGAFIAIGTGLAHFSCVFFGAECYRLQMAPEVIVESARNGTWLAPVAALLIAGLFVVLGLYALSGARLIRRLPLLTLGIYGIGITCVIRGLLPLQLWVRHPEKVSEPVIIVGLVWLLAGLLYLTGYRMVIRNDKVVDP